MQTTIPKAKTIRRKYTPGTVTVRDDQATPTQIVEARLARQKLKSLSDTIAQDTLFYKNHYYPGGREVFADKKELQSVDKFYPYADGGPLFVDECSRDFELPIYLEKEKVMKKLGLRYLLIKPGMTELEAIEALA